MTWWNALLGGAGGLVEAGGKIYTSVAGNQAERDQQISAEQIQLLASYGAEFAARENRTKWDSLADGLNRIVRPALAIGVQLTFVWAAIDPPSFVEAMQALAIVPEQLWFIWMGVWAFYFTGRIIERAPKSWKIDPAQVALAKEIVAEREVARIRREISHAETAVAEDAATTSK